MLSPIGSERPSFEQIREHPWMKKDINLERTRMALIDRSNEINTNKSSASTTTGNNSPNMQAQRAVNADDFKSPIRGSNPKLPSAGCKTEIKDKALNDLIK